MPRLALYTFAVLKSPLSDPGELTAEFYEVGDTVYQAFSEHPGYLGHAAPSGDERGLLFGADWGPWGEFTVPAWYGKGRTAQTTALAATLSLWTGVPHAFDAAYTGIHRTALNRRYDWFERSGYANHACWWVPDGVTPTWQDAVSKLEHLHAHGPAPHAFSLHRPFTPEGTPAGDKGVGPEGARRHPVGDDR
ncbi:DUF3291 domain-containing protein [Kitasatospora sp. NPDC089797]|uniref:DUF3291 domain-containing protein n=1 Tax=Kitasatospora sp. NPDC089797 TaxID=3155298 RepID=UPI003441D500